jgi:hypothetical protein
MPEFDPNSVCREDLIEDLIQDLENERHTETLDLTRFCCRTFLFFFDNDMNFRQNKHKTSRTKSERDSHEDFQVWVSSLPDSLLYRKEICGIKSARSNRNLENAVQLNEEYN